MCESISHKQRLAEGQVFIKDKMSSGLFKNILMLTMHFTAQ